MIDIGNPLYFCYWLQCYLAKGGNDLEKIRQFVEIPIRRNVDVTLDNDKMKDPDSWGKE